MPNREPEKEINNGKDGTVENASPRHGFISWMEEKIFPVLSRLNELKFLQAMRESVFSSIPLIVVGFIVLFFVLVKKGTLSERALSSFSGALGLLGVWISFYLPFTMRKDQQGKLTAMLSGFLCLGVFAAGFPPMAWTPDSVVGLLSLLSRGGILAAMLIAGVFAGLESKIGGKLDKNVLIPKILALVICLVPILILKYAGVNIYGSVEGLIKPLVGAGDTLPAAVVIVFLMCLFFLFGIHGTGVIGGMILPFYLVLYNENVAARAAGLPIPHIITPSFFIWSMIGGTGATLPLCVYMLRSKVKRLKKIAAASILPSLVNVNEPLLFGVPLIMNPITAVPYLVTPMVIAVINYTVLYYNLAGRVFIMAPFVIPQPFHAYACTLDVRNIFLLLLDMVVAFVIYYPFFRALEREEMRKEKELD